MPQTEAFARTLIDAQLRDQGWNINDGISVRYEYTLADRDRADYLLCGREGRGLATIEAKRESINAADASEQGRHNAEQADVPFVFLANGKEIRSGTGSARRTRARSRRSSRRPTSNAAPPRARCASIRSASPSTRASSSATTRPDCIDALCREIGLGRRKLLVEMATGTGKTRTAAAFIKRLFEANAITRVLFLVDRIPLAKQTEDAFAEHLTRLPCYVLRAGRRFQDEKRITITTLQSMVNIYHEYSSGYFDLVISDECHRSIYGKWRRRARTLRRRPDRADRNPLRHADRRKKAATRRTTAFVRDTLRFFEVDKPTFSYKLKRAIDEGYLVAYQIYKAQTVKTATADGIKILREDIQWDGLDAKPATNSKSLRRRRQPQTAVAHIPSTPTCWSASSPSRSAIGPWCASSARCWKTATSTRRAICASRCSVRPSSSRSPSATPKRSPTLLDANSPTKSPRRRSGTPITSCPASGNGRHH